MAHIRRIDAAKKKQRLKGREDWEEKPVGLGSIRETSRRFQKGIKSKPKKKPAFVVSGKGLSKGDHRGKFGKV